MFYCDPCGEGRGWPINPILKSSGPCEVCGVTALCNDIPSKELPIPGKTMEETRVIDRKASERLAKVVNINTYRQKKGKKRR